MGVDKPGRVEGNSRIRRLTAEVKGKGPAKAKIGRPTTIRTGATVSKRGLTDAQCANLSTAFEDAAVSSGCDYRRSKDLLAELGVTKKHISNAVKNLPEGARGPVTGALRSLFRT